MVENVNSPTTLLESFHYDISESSMGRRLSISALDFNRGRQNTEPLGFGGKTEYTALARHLVSGWDMHLGRSMFNNVDLAWELSVDSLEATLFFELELIPIELEDDEGGENEEEEEDPCS
ncbi:hypothetical protein J1N35_038360 [Gossypium stocksii]|uniref:Uncharacterized protein n=1 Tax=Gossypium stocksii TaxID=47602 RepID=A0A9D3ULX1_9ROSI|nr:hypothetical protein J1N35_038360 [Gossypium stocksii]